MRTRQSPSSAGTAAFRFSRRHCVALAMAATVWTRPGHAAEGATSNYFPGSYGNLLVAVAPEPGFLLWLNGIPTSAAEEIPSPAICRRISPRANNLITSLRHWIYFDPYGLCF